MARPRILVVDDDNELLRAIARTLQRAGFEVNAADCGAQAMQLLEQHFFDAVLTDVAMPGMDGLAVLRAVRERDMTVPVLLLTGKPGVDSAVEAVRCGASEYMIKPVTNEHLEATIRRVVSAGGVARAQRDSSEVLAAGRPAEPDRARLDETLDTALDSMWMAYQPIVDARTHTLFGYEALLRSGEPTLPHPGAVLDAAERLGRLDDVGRRVRSIAPTPMALVPSPALLFVNLHASDLNDDALTSLTAPLTSIAARVILEITERASLDAVNDAPSRVARLRELGFRIAIDDLGAGYAGLTAFAQLEPEFVKLDMTLVRDVHKSPMKQKLVRSMTAMCKDMGIVVVAEGIEVVEEREVIIGLGCDLLQGYLLAKPGRPFPHVCW